MIPWIPLLLALSGGPDRHGDGPGDKSRHEAREHRTATWFDSAVTGRSRRAWSGVVELELPAGRRDTAKVCGGPNGFRIDFPNGKSLWESAGRQTFLDPATRTARQSKRGHKGFRGPPPGMAAPIRLGSDTVAGRPAVVYAVRGPRGGSHRMWLDTTLPLLLRGEGPGPGARRILSLDLSRGCPQDAFQVPRGWAVEKGPPPPPPPVPVASSEELERAVGFPVVRPSWLPAGFEPAGLGWIDGGRHRVAHLRWSDGSRLVSIFVHPRKRAFRDCEDDRPCPTGGPDPSVVRRLDGRSILVTGPLDPSDLKRIADGLR